MQKQYSSERYATLYPVLEELTQSQKERLSAIPTVTVEEGTVLFEENQPCQAFPLVLEGGVKVYKQSSQGREILLYRVLPGESCIVSLNGLVQESTYLAQGCVEQRSCLMLVPRKMFLEWLVIPAFQRYVMSLFSARLTDLLQKVEEVAFHRLDARLAAALLGQGRMVHKTHAALANELSSVREMVSRLLKKFEAQGLVKLSREQVEICDPAGLRLLAESA